MDASALVHLCAPGTGSDLAVKLWNRADLVATSRLAEVEIPAVLRAGHRAGALDATEHRDALAVWQQVRAGLHFVEVNADVCDRASAIVDGASASLRADDAIHVASALVLAHEETLVAAWDDAVAGAVRREGMTVVP